MIGQFIFISFILLILFFYLMLHPYLFIMNKILEKHCDNKPFLDKSDFPLFSDLEKEYPKIKKEFNDYSMKIHPFHTMLPEFTVLDIDEQERNNRFWRVLPLKTAGDIIRENARLFPSLDPFLKEPNLHNMFFSVLEPKVNIPVHKGYYKGYLRYHLGVIIPEENGLKPFINVGGETYYWKEGEGVVFDDMFDHYVENPTNKNRVVLFIDLVRPLDGFLGVLNRWNIQMIEKNPLIKKIQEIQHNSVKI